MKPTEYTTKEKKEARKVKKVGRRESGFLLSERAQTS